MGDGAAATASGQQVDASASVSPSHVCALNPILRGVPRTAARLHSGGGVKAVVSGPRTGRVVYTVVTPSTVVVEEAMVGDWQFGGVGGGSAGSCTLLE